MQIPSCPVIALAVLPPDPASAAMVVAAAADDVENQLREVLTDGVHPSASLAWLVKGPAAISLIRARDPSNTAQNALIAEAKATGIPTAVLVVDIAQRYRRFLAMETLITGHRRRVTLGLPGWLARPDLDPPAQIAGMADLFNSAMADLWAGLAEVMTA